MYKNSKSVKDALEKWGGKREDIFLLQKCEYIIPAMCLSPPYWWEIGGSGGGDSESEKNPKVILKGLLQEMGVDYVDLCKLSVILYVEFTFWLNT